MIIKLILAKRAIEQNISQRKSNLKTRADQKWRGEELNAEKSTIEKIWQKKKCFEERQTFSYM